MDWFKQAFQYAGGAFGGPVGAAGAGFVYDWTRGDKGDNDDKRKTSDYVGQLASIGAQAYAAKKSRKKQAQATQNTGKLDLGYLRQEAENNGFNPLTVLQSTGGAGSTKSSNAGLLASSQFWATYADGLGELNNRQYEQGLIEQSKPKNKLTDLEAENEAFLDRHGISLTVPVYNRNTETGKKIISHYVVNPELMETQLSEAWGSLIVQGLQYSFQKGIPITGFFDVVRDLPKAVQLTAKNLYKEFKEGGGLPSDRKTLIDIVNKAIAREITDRNNMNEKIDKQSIGDIPQPSKQKNTGIKGLTDRARQRQNRINKKMGWNQ